MKSFFNFLTILFSSIKKAFNRMLPEIKDAIHYGVVIVDKLNSIIASPTMDILTAIIPSELDDAIKNRLRLELPKILVNLRLADACKDETDPQKILECALNTLNSLGDTYKAAFLHDLAIIIAQVAADGKLSWSDGVYVLEWYYKNKYKPEYKQAA